MAIDVATETLLSLRQAARRLPPGRNGRPCHPATVFRWIQEGARRPNGKRVYLDGVRLVQAECWNNGTLRNLTSVDLGFQRAYRGYPEEGSARFRSLRCRPPIKLLIHKAAAAAWTLFRGHYYLTAGLHLPARGWVATWNDLPGPS